MPLTNDDVPGSWGVLSEGWPEIEFRSEQEVAAATYATHKFLAIPYGSYVNVSNWRHLRNRFILRLETDEYKNRVEEYMDEWRKGR